MNAIVPYVEVEDVKRLANIVRALRNDVFRDGHDFGIIPGTGDKPTLLQPGMEKLMRALKLRPEYVEKSRVEDFDSGVIFYRYECRLVEYETGLCVSTAIGSANSRESKWRYRNADRVCPNCGKSTIIKSKAEYGGGWLCFAKKGGCGSKFKDGDPAIEAQAVGKVENPDIFDQMNTIDKVAQKRALGSAIKGAANVSEFFTVDLEDFQTFDVAPIVVERPQSSQKPAHDVDGVVIEEPHSGPQTGGNWATGDKVARVLAKVNEKYPGTSLADMRRAGNIEDIAPEAWNVYPTGNAAYKVVLAALDKATEQPTKDGAAAFMLSISDQWQEVEP